jgi:hypothetical protein
MPENHSTGPDLVAEVAALLTGESGGRNKGKATPGAVTSESLKKLTQRQLAEVANKLGLSPGTKIKKDALAKLVLDAWQALLARQKDQPASATTAAGADVAPDHLALSHKFEVGEAGRAGSNESRQMLRESSKEIPWGYGRDRVTAMAVDPDRLFAYWELLDQSIAACREQLGKGGAGAWVNLRVYDTTGRIFDGTNAHSTFDHRVERGDRQWFFPIGKPTSELIVEIGLKSEEGYFVKIARSGRVEFPRRDQAPWSEPEWLTVRMARGQIEGGAGARPLGRAVPSTGAPLPGPIRQPTPIEAPTANLRRVLWQGAGPMEGAGAESQEWEEVHSDGTTESHHRFRWEGPATITSWEAGPFPYPVEVPEPVRETFAGKTRVFRLGARTHVVHGPWQVVIRGLGALKSRVVVSRWEVYRSWSEVTGHAVEEFGTSFVGGGASERMVGASDRRWAGGSELRIGGSSELHFLQASELRLGGASERMYAGSSESIRRGASERLFQGSSEKVVRGPGEGWPFDTADTSSHKGSRS